MTVRELITKVNQQKPNSFPQDVLISFVNEVEAEIAEELRMKEKPVYSAATLDDELLVPAPYDGIYQSFVKARIDFANEEYLSYENNQVQFAQDFNDVRDWIIRTGAAVDHNKRRRFKNTF
jgi:hypothetical protein